MHGSVMCVCYMYMYLHVQFIFYSTPSVVLNAKFRNRLSHSPTFSPCTIYTQTHNFLHPPFLTTLPCHLPLSALLPPSPLLPPPLISSSPFSPSHLPLPISTSSSPLSPPLPFPLLPPSQAPAAPVSSLPGGGESKVLP